MEEKYVNDLVLTTGIIRYDNDKVARRVQSADPKVAFGIVRKRCLT